MKSYTIHEDNYEAFLILCNTRGIVLPRCITPACEYPYLVQDNFCLALMLTARASIYKKIDVSGRFKRILGELDNNNQ